MDVGIGVEFDLGAGRRVLLTSTLGVRSITAGRLSESDLHEVVRQVAGALFRQTDRLERVLVATATEKVAAEHVAAAKPIS